MAENEHVVSIEELSARKVVKRVGSSQASGRRSHDQQPPVVATVEIHDEEVISSSTKEKLQKMLKEFDETAHNQIPDAAKPKIQRIPPILRDQKDFVKYYVPRAVSIGPIHHGKPKFQVSDEYKPKLTAKFIKESGSTNGGEDLYLKIRNKIEELRDCYEEEVTKSYDDESLAWMLFLDGCSTLQFIHSLVHDELKKHFKIKNDQISFAQQDLFLLENQLPYRVLELLIMNNRNKDRYKDSIVQFIRNNVTAPDKLTRKIHLNMDEEKPAHLLELLQLALLRQPKKDTQHLSQPEKDTQHLSQPEKDTQHLSQPKKDTQQKEKKSTFKHKLKHLFKPGHSQYSYRNVQELKAAGIQLKPSGSCCLKDITFYSLCFAGYLKLPQLTVDDSTGPLFSNLIAYEMLPDNFRTEYGVSSYISFLDELIDNADDVKDLRSANILRNRLGSDLEVTELFNQIGTDLVPDPDAYKKVKDKIQKHYRSKWMTWMAQVYYDHFNNPWTIIAFNAALVALALSSVQTWFTVFSPPGPCDNFCSNFTMPHKP